MKHFIVLGLSVLCALVVIEVMLRVLHYPYVGCASVSQVDENRIGQFDAALGWKYIPSRSTKIGTKIYTFNAEGYRTARIEDATDFSKPRILIVGSSFLFGHELNFEETFGFKLKERLANKFEVLNFAVQGYGLDQTYLLLQQVMPVYKPTYVILDIHEDQDYRNVNRDRRALFPCLQFAGTKPTFTVINNTLMQTHVPERFETYDNPRLRLVWRRIGEKLRQQKTNFVLAETLYRQMKRYVSAHNATLFEINYLMPIRVYQMDPATSSSSAMVVDYGREYTLDGVHPNDQATTRMVEEFLEKFGPEIR